MAEAEVIYKGTGSPRANITFGGIADGKPDTVQCGNGMCIVPASLVKRFESQQDIRKALKAGTLKREKPEVAAEPAKETGAPAGGK